METILFIDSGYLSFISRYFGKNKPLKYKIEEFAERICREKKLQCKKVYFYIAPPFQSPIPTEHERKRRASYDKFIEKLKNVKPQIIIREGRCQKIDNIFQQKGVDTLMTMDLLRVPKRESINTLIILTSDTDFAPIIKDIRSEGVKVILAYFTDKKRKSAFSLSNHLWKAVDDRILIKREFFNI